MIRQRGLIAQGYLYAAGLLALVLAVTAAIMAWHSLTKSIDKAGYDRGVAETDSIYKARDNAQLQAVVAAQAEAQAKVAEAETKAATARSEAMSAYSKGVIDGKNKLAAFIASGQRLRDPGIEAGASAACNSGATKGTPDATASGDHGAKAGELSAKASGFLLNLASEADTVALQLTAAQSRIKSDYELCK